ncbi:MAG: hypothetical protein U0930_07230 [Pirellulales bacterium]
MGQKSPAKTVSVSHDSRCIVLTGVSNAGLCDHCEQGSSDWLDAYKTGRFVAWELLSDRGGTAMRFIFDRPLSDFEEDEWCSKITAYLDLLDNRVAICGSTDFLCEQYFSDPEMVRKISVVPGTYRVDIYSCFVGINGPAFNAVLQNYEGEPLGSWFRRTRPDAEFPLWLRRLCQEYSEVDPGYQEVWTDRQLISRDVEEECNTTWVDFMIQFTPSPIETQPALREGVIPAPSMERRLERCPLGIKV